ncbi:MAG: alpha/beta fold hydrolase, partial [Myxococcota bacterium]
MPELPAARRIQLPPLELATGETERSLCLSVHEAGEGPAVVLCHGFPELAYSWRHQFGPLRDAGLRVIVPDQRGYGESDVPEGIESYDIDHLTGDMAGLLDALEIDKAVFVGHDWGGFVAWAMPILYPERTAGVIGVNTPYMARGPIPPTELIGLAAGGNPEKIYILWFQEPGVAESVLDSNPALVFERLMRKSAPLEEVTAQIAESGGDMNPFRRLEELPETSDPLLDDEELAVYTRSFERSGFRGGISWYRNLDRNWKRHPEIGTEKISHPALMVTSQWDLALRPEMAADMPS